MTIVPSPLILTAMLAGGLLSLLTGPLGCLVVWRRMAYFGDAVSHAALLGVTLALLLEVEMQPMILLVALGVAALLARGTRDTRFHADTLLGLLAHGALAVALLTLALSRQTQVDVNAFLFGDILTVTTQDVLALAALALVGGVFLYWNWRALVLATLEPNLARVEGYQVARLNLLLALLIACTIALAIKLVGALLVTALLIMPAACARPLARSPEGMARLAIGCSLAAVIGGLALALWLDSPSGATIVSTALAMTLASLLWVKRG